MGNGSSNTAARTGTTGNFIKPDKELVAMLDDEETKEYNEYVLNHNRMEAAIQQLQHQSRASFNSMDPLNQKLYQAVYTGNYDKTYHVSAGSTGALHHLWGRHER